MKKYCYNVGLNKKFMEDNKKNSSLVRDDYWTDDGWKQPPVKIKHGDLVDVKCENYPIMLGRYIGKGFGVVELYDYASGISHHVGKVMSRGINKNPRLISDKELLNFIKD